MKRSILTAGLALAVAAGGVATLTVAPACGGPVRRRARARRAGPGGAGHRGGQRPGAPDAVPDHRHQNGGNRRAGTAGYTASVAYVKSKLQAAGYTVTEQTCTELHLPVEQPDRRLARRPRRPGRHVRRAPRQRLGRPGHQRQRLRLGGAAGERAGPGRSRTRP